MPGAMMAGGAAMTIAGDVLSALEQDRVHDLLSNLPLLEKVDFTKEQGETIKANLAALPAATTLAEKSTLAEVDAMKKSMAAMGLDYEKWNQLVSGNVEAGLQGKPFTEDMSAQVLKSAAKAFSGGYAGSGMHGNLTARDLGLQAMSVRERALQDAESWLATTKAFMPAPLTVSSMMLTPQQRILMGMQQNKDFYQTQLTRIMGEATPDLQAAFGSLLQKRGGEMMGMGGMMGDSGGGSNPGGTGGSFFGM